MNESICFSLVKPPVGAKSGKRINETRLTKIAGANVSAKILLHFQRYMMCISGTKATSQDW